MVIKEFLGSKLEAGFGSLPSTWVLSIRVDGSLEPGHGDLGFLLAVLGFDVAAANLDSHLGQLLFELLDPFRFSSFLLGALLPGDLDLLLGDLFLFRHLFVIFDIFKVRIMVIINGTSLEGDTRPTARGSPGMLGVDRKSVEESVRVIIGDRLLLGSGIFGVLSTWEIAFTEERVVWVDGGQNMQEVLGGGSMFIFDAKLDNRVLVVTCLHNFIEDNSLLGRCGARSDDKESVGWRPVLFGLDVLQVTDVDALALVVGYVDAISPDGLPEELLGAHFHLHLLLRYLDTGLGHLFLIAVLFVITIMEGSENLNSSELNS